MIMAETSSSYGGQRSFNLRAGSPGKLRGPAFVLCDDGGKNFLFVNLRYSAKFLNKSIGLRRFRF